MKKRERKNERIDKAREERSVPPVRLSPCGAD